MTAKTTTVYIPSGPDASERWDIVAAALRANGITDLRPAPLPAQNYKPRLSRPDFISAQEI
ncbi:hypothetical protein GGE65_007675 [Skermanella aerolata]|uniref:hypothetical protein n=1 Tax=Skermanella aerolata TaxID=393310 RepID=UPI003D1C05B4